jgi:magnesium-transporting ATPase (P-type)
MAGKQTKTRGTGSMKPESGMANDGTDERRADTRRHFSAGTVRGALFKQRRRLIRRDLDRINSYIDWYGPWPFLASVVIIVLCFADALLTMILLNNGAKEMNILMDLLIKHDVRTFAITKMAITSVAIIVLVMHFNFRFYRIIAVRYLMYALVPVYALLIAHEINMLSQI